MAHSIASGALYDHNVRGNLLFIVDYDLLSNDYLASGSALSLPLAFNLDDLLIIALLVRVIPRNVLQAIPDYGDTQYENGRRYLRNGRPGRYPWNE